MTVSKDIIHGKTCEGIKRKKNDDRFLITHLNKKHLLLAVSDGLGGHSGGDIAAEEIMRCLVNINISNSDTSSLLKAAINEADANILKKVKKDSKLIGMGATVTSAIICEGWVNWAHIGDSRLYLMRDKALSKITKNHTFLQDLVDIGDISEEEAECHPMCHVLDQCVGCIDAGVDCGKFEVFPGDILLLCTDGVYNSITEKEIIEILLSEQFADLRVQGIIEACIQSKNKDDATVVVCNIEK